jgi:hypothetical protein
VSRRELADIADALDDEANKIDAEELNVRGLSQSYDLPQRNLCRGALPTLEYFTIEFDKSAPHIGNVCSRRGTAFSQVDLDAQMISFIEQSFQLWPHQCFPSGHAASQC